MISILCLSLLCCLYSPAYSQVQLHGSASEVSDTMEEAIADMYEMGYDYKGMLGDGALFVKEGYQYEVILGSYGPQAYARWLNNKGKAGWQLVTVYRIYLGKDAATGKDIYQQHNIFVRRTLTPRVMPHVVTDSTVVADSRIDINTATQMRLQSIPGIGPTLSQRIIAGRPYTSVEQLLTVDGIGAVTLSKIFPYVRVE